MQHAQNELVVAVCNGRQGHLLEAPNGAHERMHGDISLEIEALGQSDQAAMDIWRHSFNYEWPHEALLMRCPGELYRVSERKYQGTPEDLDYPQMSSRRVSAQGTFHKSLITLFERAVSSVVERLVYT
jgi:hypothetical protein